MGVAQSKTPEGPFQFVSCFKPDGDGSLDMTLYQDDDGSAYHVRSDDNKFAAVSKLTDDYLNTTGKVCSSGPLMEGNCIIKRDGQYWMLGSRLTGWAANSGLISSADSSATPCASSWKSHGPFTDSKNTFNSQSTFVLKLKVGAKFVYMYQGDRWNEGGPGS